MTLYLTAYQLNIYRMIQYSVNINFLIFTRPDNSHMGTINAPDNIWKCIFEKKSEKNTDQD